MQENAEAQERETSEAAAAERIDAQDLETAEPNDDSGETHREPERSPLSLENEVRSDAQGQPFAFTGHPILSRMRALRYVRANHSIVFFLYAAIGVAVLILVKALNWDFKIALYFGVVFLIMGSYFVLNMLDFAGLKLRYDLLGDNLYYLGFIYTLGILTHTLYVFEIEAEYIHEIISSFGIALSSTVLGVVLRIMAHLMRLDPHEVEDAVRTELRDLSSRVRAVLDAVVRDMTIFGDQTRQAISELQDEVSDDISGNVEKLVSASNRVLESVDESFRVYTENTSRINQLSEQTVSVLSALVAKIEAIEAPSNLIEQKLIPATNQIELIVAAMSETSKQEEERVERLKAVTESMNDVISSVRENLNLISSAASQEEIAARVSLAAGALKDMSESVVALRDEMKKLVESESEAVTSLRGEYQSAVANIREQNLAMKSELERFRSVTSQTQDALIELAKALKEAV